MQLSKKHFSLAVHRKNVLLLPQRYHDLWHIEESFRIKKHSLKIRPIFHWLEDRIRAHISICYMGFAMCRHLQYRTRLQQKKDLSVESIREGLLGVKSTIIEDTPTEKRYRFPVGLSEQAKRIYKTMGIRRSTTPTEITEPEKYQNRMKYTE